MRAVGPGHRDEARRPGWRWWARSDRGVGAIAALLGRWPTWAASAAYARPRAPCCRRRWRCLVANHAICPSLRAVWARERAAGCCCLASGPDRASYPGGLHGARARDGARVRLGSAGGRPPKPPPPRQLRISRHARRDLRHAVRMFSPADHPHAPAVCTLPFTDVLPAPRRRPPTRRARRRFAFPWSSIREATAPPGDTEARGIRHRNQIYELRPRFGLKRSAPSRATPTWSATAIAASSRRSSPRARSTSSWCAPSRTPARRNRPCAPAHGSATSRPAGCAAPRSPPPRSAPGSTSSSPRAPARPRWRRAWATSGEGPTRHPLNHTPPQSRRGRNASSQAFENFRRQARREIKAGMCPRHPLGRHPVPYRGMVASWPIRWSALVNTHGAQAVDGIDPISSTGECSAPRPQTGSGRPRRGDTRGPLARDAPARRGPGAQLRREPALRLRAWDCCRDKIPTADGGQTVRLFADLPAAASPSNITEVASTEARSY